ncbi:hypothetical protein [Rhodococcus aetherivorans]|uniref:hypothetical protein n=1 Tax=Rhodococcus aetherivorans TaxID=191292 RepID=UPI000A729C45|nr:hypothetical protein [Rhodococcus aetherivorans]
MFIGRVREKTPLFRTEKSRDADGRSYPWIKSTGMVDYYYYYYYYYYYCVAADFGPFFLEFCSSIPLQRQTLYQRPPPGRASGREGRARVHRTGTRQRVRPRSTIRSCCMAICDRLTGARIDVLLRKWLAMLPDPFPDADRGGDFRRRD